MAIDRREQEGTPDAERRDAARATGGPRSVDHAPERRNDHAWRRQELRRREPQARDRFPRAEHGDAGDDADRGLGPRRNVAAKREESTTRSRLRGAARRLCGSASQRHRVPAFTARAGLRHPFGPLRKLGDDRVVDLLVRVELVVGRAVLEVELHDRVEDLMQLAALARLAEIGLGLGKVGDSRGCCRWISFTSAAVSLKCGAASFDELLRLRLAVVDRLVDARPGTSRTSRDWP